MARSWEYSRQRRAAMQIAMWVILGLTLALAGLVSHHTHAELHAPLDSPTIVGDLMVRLPKGWQYSIFRSDDVLVIRSKEPANDTRRQLHVIQVTQQRVTDPAINAEGYLSNNVLSADLHVTPLRFAGLKTDGVSTEIQEQDEQNAMQGAAPPGLYAATLVPRQGGERLAVVVSVEDLAPFTPADHDALQQVADAITVAGNTK